MTPENIAIGFSIFLLLMCIPAGIFVGKILVEITKNKDSNR